MEIRFNPLDPTEVEAVSRVLGFTGEPTSVKEVEKSYLPEDEVAKPEATTAPVEEPAKEEAAPAAEPDKAPEVTLDTLRNTLSAINEKDKKNLVHVKTALTNYGVKKASELDPKDYAGFYDMIKEYA